MWFDFADRPTPENVAEVTARNGRIIFANALVDSLAATVAGMRISLEPDFDDDPTLSTDVVYTGTVEANTGLAEIKMFVAGEGTGGIIIGDIRPFRA